MKHIHVQLFCESGSPCFIKFRGDDGIRTHVPGKSDKLISSQSRYGLFGTSPFDEGSAYESEPLLLYYIFEGFSNTFYTNSEIFICRSL